MLEQVKVALTERGRALDQLEVMRGHKRVLKKEVLLLREAAEGARIEAEALRRQLDEAARGTALREQTHTLNEYEHERLMATCLQLRGILASADVATATGCAVGAVASAPPSGRTSPLVAWAVGGAAADVQAFSRDASREISCGSSRPESPGASRDTARAVLEARSRAGSVLSTHSTTSRMSIASSDAPPVASRGVSCSASHGALRSALP